jgi:hypothetical protein
LLRVFLAGFIIAWSIVPTTAMLKKQCTNMNDPATVLSTSVNKNDLIIIHPWYYAIGFSRYYHGAAPYVTLPDIEDHRIHRFDLVKLKMMSTSPIDSLFIKIDQTYNSGHAVWVVGFPIDNSNDNEYETLMPAPDREYGWSEGIYCTSWMQQVTSYLQKYFTQKLILQPDDTTINGYEYVTLYKMTPLSKK